MFVSFSYRDPSCQQVFQLPSKCSNCLASVPTAYCLSKCSSSTLSISGSSAARAFKHPSVFVVCDLTGHFDSTDLLCEEGMAQSFGAKDIRYPNGQEEPEQVVEEIESGPQEVPVLTSTNPCGLK